MGLFFYTKIGSIISIGDLPTTNIIEPFFHYVTIALFHIVESRTGQRNATQRNFYSRLKLEQYATIPKTFLEINLIFPINLFTSYFN